MGAKVKDGNSGGGVTDHGNLSGLDDNDHSAVYVKYVQNGTGGQIQYQYGGAVPSSPSDGTLWWEVVSA